MRQVKTLEFRNEVEHLGKLPDAHLEGTIEADGYKSKKQELINAKINFQEKITDFERKGNNWLEPLPAIHFSESGSQKNRPKGK